MSRLGSMFVALVFCSLSTHLLITSLLGTRWISACLSLTSMVMMRKGDETVASVSLRKMHFPSNDKEVSNQNGESILMSQEIMNEKNWLFDKLNSKQVCFTQGFFAYCMNGDGFFELGDYHLCITSTEANRQWTRTENTTVHSIYLSLFASILSIIFISFSFYVQYIRGVTRTSEMFLRLTSILSFTAGSAILYGLFPVAIQALSYSFNTTNFYNDMIKGLGTAYFVGMKVNWEMKDGDLSEAQAWARNIVNNFSGIGLDVDFFLTLLSGIFLYLACAALLVRFKGDQLERYSSGFGVEGKYS